MNLLTTIAMWVLRRYMVGYSKSTYKQGTSQFFFEVSVVNSHPVMGTGTTVQFLGEAPLLCVHYTVPAAELKTF